MRKLELAGPIAAGLLVSTAAYAAPSGGRQMSPNYANQAGRNGQVRQAKPAPHVQPAAAPIAPPQCETVSSDPLAPAIKEVVLSPQFANHVAHPADLKGVQVFYARADVRQHG